MIIHVNDKYFIKTDSRNHTLRERYTGVDKHGEPKEHIRTIGYFNSVAQALGRLIHIEASEQDVVMNVEEYIDELDRLAAKYGDLIE